MSKSYLNSALKQANYYKSLGDKTLERLTTAQLFYTVNSNSNSIAVLVKHLAGNMCSRWTRIFTEDGEKPDRNRDDEFVNTFDDKEEMLAYWERGWHCFIHTLEHLETEDLDRIIYIRNHGHTVVEAINRQLSHYPYHIGQMVFIAKLLLDDEWQSLSIAKNASETYNREKFQKEKSRKHFTDDL